MTRLRCVDRRVHTAVLTPRSAAYTIAALCLFLSACNIPVLSPEEKSAISSLGPVASRQEQIANKLETLTSKVEANIQAGGDVTTKQEQSLAKIDANLKAQDAAVVQLKGAITAQDAAVAQLKVATSQSAGRDAEQNNPTQTGLLNFVIQASKGHEDGIATSIAGIASILGFWRALRKRGEQAKMAQAKVDTLVRGVESASEKIEQWVNGKGTPPGLNPKIVKDEIARVAQIRGTYEAIDAEARQMKPRKRD